MKRNTLLIAIAVIAVVGIAVGLFLSGAGQTDPLQGTLLPKPTILTLEYTVPMEDGWGGFMLDLHGRLTDSTGAPVANRAVNIKFTVPGEPPTPPYRTLGPGETPTPYVGDAGTATTGADGSYSVQFQQWSGYYTVHPVYTARFGGDSAYLASQSPNVVGPP
jgi:hypothetical protein